MFDRVKEEVGEELQACMEEVKAALDEKGLRADLLLAEALLNLAVGYLVREGPIDRGQFLRAMGNLWDAQKADQEGRN